VYTNRKQKEIHVISYRFYRNCIQNSKKVNLKTSYFALFSAVVTCAPDLNFEKGTTKINGNVHRYIDLHFYIFFMPFDMFKTDLIEISLFEKLNFNNF